MDSFLVSVEDDLKELEMDPLGEGWLLDCWSSPVGEPVSLLWPLRNDDNCFKNKTEHTFNIVKTQNKDDNYPLLAKPAKRWSKT